MIFMLIGKAAFSWGVIILALVLVFSGLYYIVDFKSQVYEDSNVSGRVYYEFYQVNITVFKNASLSITEQWVVDFRASEGEYHFAYRIFFVSGFDDIVGFRAYELQNDSYVSLKTLVLRRLGMIALKFYFEPIRYGQRIFVIRYLVQNAVDTSGNRNVIKWFVFPEEHEYVKEAEFRVIIPSDLLTLSVQKMPFNSMLNTFVSKEGSNTVIYAKVGSLERNETVKLYCEVKKMVETPFSLKKTISLFVPYIVLATLIEIFCFVLFLVAKAFYNRRVEHIDANEVIADLDPIEFLFLQYEDPPSVLIGLSLIFYYGSKNYLKLVAEKNKLYVSEIKENSLEAPWLKEPYHRLVFVSKIQEPLVVDIGLCKELGDYASRYSNEINRSLTEKGYLGESSNLFDEMIIDSNIVLGLTIIFLEIAPLIPNVGHELFVLSLILSFLYIVMIVMLLNTHTDKRTPKGRGALKSVEKYGKSMLKLKSESNIEGNIEAIIRILRDYLPYLLGFPEFAKLLIKMLYNIRDLEAKYQLYLMEKLMYIHAAIIATELLKPLIEPILDALAYTIMEVLNSVKNDLARSLSRLKKRASSTGFKGGGIAGFG